MSAHLEYPEGGKLPEVLPGLVKAIVGTPLQDSARGNGESVLRSGQTSPNEMPFRLWLDTAHRRSESPHTTSPAAKTLKYFLDCTLYRPQSEKAGTLFVTVIFAGRKHWVQAAA